MQSTWQDKYLHDAGGISDLPDHVSGETSWDCPSNIAVLKYWGKKGLQQPLNPSLSFSLEESKTHVDVSYSVNRDQKGLSLAFFFDDKPNQLFEDRFLRYLHQIIPYMPFLDQTEMVIRASNTFPHSAGIASSASSFGALALSLCSIENKAFGTLAGEQEFISKASFLARLGSGSACRSVFGGFSLWGHTGAVNQSSDEKAISLGPLVDPVFSDYCDSIMVIQAGRKEISSSAGHQLMEHHPFNSARMVQANENLEKMIVALKTGDESVFADLVEEEALTLHAMMMTSRPGYILLKPASLEVISRIRQFRISTGLPVSFTMDAGANIHILYPARIRIPVVQFIETELAGFCEQRRVIHDRVGKGPVHLNGSHG
jgi:diphosphomevalonate decarboxylase